MMRRPTLRSAPRLALLLTAVSTLLAHPAAPAQTAAAAWRLESGGSAVQVRETRTHGYAALPVSSLASVGAELAYEGESVVARLGAAEVRFTPGAREVATGDGPRTLLDPVYAEGGSLFVPAEFFARYLAEAAGGALEVIAEQRTVRRVTAEQLVAAAPPAAPPAAPAPVPQTTRTSTQPPVTAPHAGASASSTVQAPARPPASTPGVRRRLVVVDAGHGGVDPGAHGPSGTREKDVTLRVARMVAALLREDPTLDVRMTRDRDTLIALHDRGRFANAWRADGQPAVFISIHCNANESRSEKGYETYFLSEARTTDARRVENFENASVQYEERNAASDALAYIFTDLRQNHYLRESSEWAQMIQDGLHTIHPGPDRGVKQAGFAVLRGTFMPSVLVEIGFISNAREEQMLLDEQMERSIAQRLAQSVRAYFGRPSVRSASN